MSILRHLSHRLLAQLAQLEYAAGSHLLQQMQTSANTTAGISTLAQRPAAQSQHPRTSQQQHQRHWQLGNSSSSSSSRSAQWSSQLTQLVRQYSQCDCPMLGGPTPDVVVVEYDDEEVDRFIALADAIEAAFPNIVVEGNPNGAGRPGSFEVKGQTGQMLFSRLSNGGWPDEQGLLDAIAAESTCSATTTASAAAAAAAAAGDK